MLEARAPYSFLVCKHGTGYSQICAISFLGIIFIALYNCIHALLSRAVRLCVCTSHLHCKGRNDHLTGGNSSVAPWNALFFAAAVKGVGKVIFALHTP